jgi:hypothetical protein
LKQAGSTLALFMFFVLAADTDNAFSLVYFAAAAHLLD